MIPIRYKVVIRSKDGKMENSNASLMFILTNRIIRDIAIFSIIITSRKKGLNGMINSSTIITTINDTALFNTFFIFYTNFLFIRNTSTRISATTP